MSYDSTLRKKFIYDFTIANNRSPTAAEIRVGLNDMNIRYTNIQNKGISSRDLLLPGFHELSSAAAEVNNRKSIKYDIEAVANEIKNLSFTLESQYRFFRTKLSRLKSIAMNFEGFLDDVLLSLNKEDAFVAAATEDFTGVFFLPETTNNVLIEGGVCMAPRNSLSKIPLDKAKITFAATSDANILASTATAPAATLLDLDGLTYEYLVLTDKQRATVNLIITIDLPEETDVGELRIGSTKIASYSNETYSAFYSYNGSDYQLLEPGNRPYNNDRIFVCVNKQKIKSIRLVLNKNVADTRTTSFGQWAFGWQFDGLELFNTSFGSNTLSEFVSSYRLSSPGNVSMFDSSVSKVTLEVCTVEPANTSISWFVSKDGQAWKYIDPYKKGSDVVTIRSTDSVNNLLKIDNTLPVWSLIDPRKIGGINVLAPNVWVLNGYFNIDSAPPPSTRIQILLDVWNNDRDSGWNRNAAGDMEIHVGVTAPEGKSINLGPKGARLNGRPVSGLTWFPPGVSKFETSVNNYSFVDKDAVNEEVLRTIDPLYPYNHKYLIEGYQYDDSYIGQQVYSGIDYAAGMEVIYEEPDEFDTDNQKWTWTYDYFSGLGWLILVRVDPTAVGLIDSEHSFSYTGEPISEEEGSRATTVWVKAVLNTSPEGDTPVIDWFTVRGL